ncbi:MAG: VanZ family protein [Deltaproteobacteria bacterium]|nr:MAG: VanZ family protein [Deltaproteobacteria bacterium]
MQVDRQVLLAWLLVALWTALVWTLSGNEFSASATSRFLGPLMRWLLPSISESTLEALHGAVRKTAHVAEYAVLALLALRALRLSAETSWLRSAALAFALALTVSIADETHQAFAEARTGSTWDVGLDAAGAFGVLAVAGLWRRRRDPEPRGGAATHVGTGGRA